jgi:hypothetical protein
MFDILQEYFLVVDQKQNRDLFLDFVQQFQDHLNDWLERFPYFYDDSQQQLINCYYFQ